MKKNNHAFSKRCQEPSFDRSPRGSIFFIFFFHCFAKPFPTPRLLKSPAVIPIYLPVFRVSPRSPLEKSTAVIARNKKTSRTSKHIQFPQCVVVQATLARCQSGTYPELTRPASSPATGCVRGACTSPGGKHGAAAGARAANVMRNKWEENRTFALPRPPHHVCSLSN